MAKLATYKRLITSDFEEKDQELIEQLAFPVNDGFNALYSVVNGRIDLRSNLFCTVRDVEIITNSSGIPINKTSFNLDKTGQVIGCQVISAINQTNSNIYPVSQPFVSFTQNSTSVTINNITGLQANNTYSIRIVAYLD